jgi:hypothetical protein
MKKVLVLLAVLGLLFMAANDSFARGIGIKGGYGIMMDDYDDAEYDNQPFFGLFFDMGTFVFNSLRFKPGVDYISMKSDIGPDFDVWGIHLDWYWYFLGSSTIKPFIGFGPALNYYDIDDDSSTDDEDSDAGIEGFGGLEIDVSGPLAVIIEARYLWHDIADRQTTIVKLGLGIQYSF